MREGRDLQHHTRTPIGSDHACIHARPLRRTMGGRPRLPRRASHARARRRRRTTRDGRVHRQPQAGRARGGARCPPLRPHARRAPPDERRGSPLAGSGGDGGRARVVRARCHRLRAGGRRQGARQRVARDGGGLRRAGADASAGTSSEDPARARRVGPSRRPHPTRGGHRAPLGAS